MTTATTTAAKSWRWWFDLATAMGFAAAIAIPALAILAGAKGGSIEGEKRKLATMPPTPASWRELRAFPKEFEEYFTDAHPWRAPLTWLAAQTWREGFGQSFARNALLGRDGWMFFNPPHRKAYYHGDQPMDAWLLGVWKRRHESTKEWLSRHGIAYLYAALPEKQNIYPEHLPSHLRPQRDRPNEIVSYFRQHIPDLNILDLEPVLRSAKDRGGLYFRTDTHWTDLGAQAGYEAIVRRLSEMGFAVGEPTPWESRRSEIRTFAGDLAQLSLLQQREGEQACFVIADPSVPPSHTTRSEPLESMPGYPAPPDQRRFITERIPDGEGAKKALPRAWVIRDSFSSALIPLLAPHFERAVWHWQSAFALDGLNLETDRPDVLIHEANERILWFMGRPYWEPQCEELWASSRFAAMTPLARINREDWPDDPGSKATRSVGDRKLTLQRKPKADRLSLSIRGPVGPASGLIVVRVELDPRPKPYELHVHGDIVPRTDERLAVANRTVAPGTTIVHLVLEHTDTTEGLSIELRGSNVADAAPRVIELRHAPYED